MGIQSLAMSMEKLDEKPIDRWWLFQPGQNSCKPGRRGYAAQREAECRRIRDELLAELSHKPTALERYTAETIASQIIEGRRLRSQGRSSLESDRLVGRLVALLMPDTPSTSTASFGAHLAHLAAREARERPGGVTFARVV